MTTSTMDDVTVAIPEAMMYSRLYEEAAAQEAGSAEQRANLRRPLRTSNDTGRVLYCDNPALMNALHQACKPTTTTTSRSRARKEAAAEMVDYSAKEKEKEKEKEKDEENAYISKLTHRLEGRRGRTNHHHHHNHNHNHSHQSGTVPDAPPTHSGEQEAKDSNSRDEVIAAMREWMEREVNEQNLPVQSPSRPISAASSTTRTLLGEIARGHFTPIDEPSLPSTMAAASTAPSSRRYSRDSMWTMDSAASTMDQIKLQPIYSYRAISNIMAAPPPLHSKGEPGVVKGLGDRRHENIQRCKRRFDHDSFQKQAELLDFLQFRSTCRDVVTTKLSRPSSASTSATDEVLSVFGNSSSDGTRRSRARPASASGPYFGKIQSLGSVWTSAVYDLTFEENKQRLCGAIEGFTLDAPAAALSKAAMENLRRDILTMIKKIKKHTPARKDLLTRAELLGFLKKHLTFSDPLRNDASQEELLDAMSSHAEAAFLQYVFGLLPN